MVVCERTGEFVKVRNGGEIVLQFYSMNFQHVGETPSVQFLQLWKQNELVKCGHRKSLRMQSCLSGTYVFVTLNPKTKVTNHSVYQCVWQKVFRICPIFNLYLFTMAFYVQCNCCTPIGIIKITIYCLLSSHAVV